MGEVWIFSGITQYSACTYGNMSTMCPICQLHFFQVDMSGAIPAAPVFVPQGSSPAEAYGPQLPPPTSSAVQPTAKTSISELMELTMRMGLVCNFETLSDSGPSHKKLFMMRCTVGDIIAEGSGYGKKKAKHEAARVALDKLKESQLYIDYVNVSG